MRLVAGTGVSLTALLGLAGVAEAADYTVDRLDDPAGAGVCATATPNDCSLRQAVQNTENANGPLVDEIYFQSGLTGTIGLPNGGLTPTEPLHLIGPGAGVLTISGGDGQRPFFIDTVAANAPVTISGLTVSDGYGSGSVGGGAIYSKDAFLTVEDSTVSNSVSGIPDAGYVGGGIRQINGSLLIRNSTISGNDGENGGGIHAADADIGIQNSTISGNEATGNGGGSGYGYGGGLWLDAGASGSLVVYGSTFADNQAAAGGGISADVTTNGIASTVIADNTAPGSPDLRSAGTDPYKLAFSLVESTIGASIVDIPTFAGSNILGGDPQLGPLAANGGPTMTHKPALTSPLVDKAFTVAGFTDQRGLARPFDVPSIANSTAPMADGSDIGSVELQAADFETAKPPTQPPAAKKCKKKRKKAKRGGASVAKRKKCKKKRRKGR